MTRAGSRSRRPSPSLHWPWCWSHAWPASPRWWRRCAASIRRGRRPGWRPVVTSLQRWRLRGGSVPAVRSCTYEPKVTSSWHASPQFRRCGSESRSRRRRWRRANLGGERGSATVVAAAMIAMMVSITMGAIVFGSAVAARHQAQAGADLAALAAAGRLGSGGAVACDWASSVAGAMRVRVTTCRIEQLDVIVSVDVPVNLGRWGLGSARAAARAGPVEPAG